MKLDNNNKKIIIAISIGLAVAAAGVTLYVNKQRKKEANMLTQVADEGYETAQDILFPLKTQRLGKRKFIPPYFRNRGRHKF